MLFGSGILGLFIDLTNHLQFVRLHYGYGRTDRQESARSAFPAYEPARHGRFHDEGRFIGFDLHERLITLHEIALGLEVAQDAGFYQTFADLWDLDLNSCQG